MITRSMGRRESDSSPDHLAGEVLPGDNAAQHAHGRTGVAAVERRVGSGERQAASLHFDDVASASLRSHVTPSARMQPSVLAQSAPVE